jgi:hypothetical protein
MKNKLIYFGLTVALIFTALLGLFFFAQGINTSYSLASLFSGVRTNTPIYSRQGRLYFTTNEKGLNWNNDLRINLNFKNQLSGKDEVKITYDNFGNYENKECKFELYPMGDFNVFRTFTSKVENNRCEAKLSISDQKVYDYFQVKTTITTDTKEIIGETSTLIFNIWTPMTNQNNNLTGVEIPLQ